MSSHLPKILIIAAALLPAGCNEFFSDLGMDASQSPQTAASEAAPVDVEASAADSTADQEPAADVVAVDDRDRIQSYLDRFPGDELSRKIDRQGQSDPASADQADQTSQASATEASQGGAAADAQQNPVEVRPLSPKSAAPPKTLTSSKTQAGKPAAIKSPTELAQSQAASNADAKPVLKSVRIAEAQPPQKPEPAPATRTNKAVQTGPPPAQETLADLIAALEKKTAEQPNDLANQFKLRLLLAADGQTDKAAEPTPGMNHETSEILTRLFLAFEDARLAAEDPVAGADKALESLDKLRRLVRSYAQLRIPKVALCRGVESFGVFKPFDPPVFIAGLPQQQAVVYTEVKNFSSQKTPDNFYKTVLSQRLEILTANSHSEWVTEVPKIVDVSCNPREDFFLTQVIDIPPSLAAGDYILKVSIEDRLSNRIQEEFVEFSVRSQTLAGTPNADR